MTILLCESVTTQKGMRGKEANKVQGGMCRCIHGRNLVSRDYRGHAATDTISRTKDLMRKRRNFGDKEYGKPESAHWNAWPDTLCLVFQVWLKLAVSDAKRRWENVRTMTTRSLTVRFFDIWFQLLLAQGARRSGSFVDGRVLSSLCLRLIRNESV